MHQGHAVRNKILLYPIPVDLHSSPLALIDCVVACSENELVKIERIRAQE